MELDIYQVDAFTDRLFSGNPAAVVPLVDFLPDHTLQAIAAENNLSETAFVVRADDGYHIRWFTPTVEVSLCGHATLASAAVVLERLEPTQTSVTFHCARGPLYVRRELDRYVLDFPMRSARKIAPPDALVRALRVTPLEVVANEEIYLARLDAARTVRTLEPDLHELASLTRFDVIVTAVGDGPYDFVSRYFAPANGIDEDPVTGSAHCMLASYWAARLGKTEFHAYQASSRGGVVDCRLRDDRVELEGSCVFYMRGTITLEETGS